jgi:hypothetical protein
MQRIELKALSGSEAAGVLYAAHQPAKCLLLWIGGPGAGAIETPTNTLTAEGWNVLLAPNTDADGIIAALAAAASHGAPSTSPRIVAVAEAASASAACAAVLALHRRGEGMAIAGFVTVDAVPDIATDPWSSLADITGLATLIAARRPATQARQSGLAWHQHLQARGRDTHFMVLEDNALTDQLADPRKAFGRELRWLLEPVNSRTDHPG